MIAMDCQPVNVRNVISYIIKVSRMWGGSLGTWQEQSLKVYNLFSLKVLVVMDSLWLWQHKSLKVMYRIAWEVQRIGNKAKTVYELAYEYCKKGDHIGYNCPLKAPIISNPKPCNQTIDELPQTFPCFDPTCYSEKENSLPYVSKPNFVDDSPNVFNPPPQPPMYSFEFCENDARYGHYCTPHPEPCYNRDFNFPQDFHNFQQQYLCCENCGGPHETFQCQLMNEDYYHEQNSCYDSNSFGFDQFQPPQYTVNHPIFNAQNELLNSQNKIMEQMTSICDMVGQYMQKKEEDRRIAEDQAAKDRYWKIPICYDDDEDYTIAITPVLLTEEPVDSLIMEDEHLDTIPATESDEVIKSSVEELVLIPSESEGISDGVCDVPLCDNPTPLKAFKDHSEIVVNSNDDDTSSDDDDFEDIEYVEASPPDLEIVSLEEVNDVDQEKEEFDLENILQIQDVILREKLLNINRLIANIESLNDNSTPNCVLKSPSPFPIPDSNSFFEKSDTSLSYSDNSLPEFESFSDHTEETSSGSTTTHANNSLPEYDSFHFEIEPDQGELTNVVMEDILGEPRVHTPNVLPTHPTLLIDSDFIIRTFLPYFTYPVISYFLFSSGSEDTIFDPGISTFHFSSLKPVAHENPIVIFLFFCFCPKDKGIRGEIPQDHEDPCLFSILQSSGLRSFAYFGILNPDHEGYNPLHVTSAATVADTWHHVAEPDPTRSRPGPRPDLNRPRPDHWNHRLLGAKPSFDRGVGGGSTAVLDRRCHRSTAVDHSVDGGGSGDGEGIVSCTRYCTRQYQAAAGQSEHDTCPKRVIGGCQRRVSVRGLSWGESKAILRRLVGEQKDFNPLRSCFMVGV
ncbi:hypothetical protein Tco_1109506 [Tanacetum coccineum]